MGKGKFDPQDPSVTHFFFETEEEALAFKDGIETASDGTIEVSEIVEDNDGEFVVVLKGFVIGDLPRKQ